MMFMGPHIRLRDVALQLKWHLQEFFFLAAVALSTFIVAAVVLWRNIGSIHEAPILTALASGYMALLLHGTTRFAYGMYRRSRALKDVPGPEYPVLIGMRFAYGMYRRSRALKDVPGPEYPVLTGMLDLLSMRDMHRVCTEYAERYGPIFKWRLFTFHAVVITDPVLATQILRSKAVDKLRFMYSFLDVFLGGTSLLTGPTDEHWKLVRKAVAPAFSQGNMREAFDHVVDRSLALVAFLKAQGPAAVHNMDNLLLMESMDVIGRFGFQKEMNALQSLTTGNEEEAYNTTALLKSTHEVEERIQEVYRWWKLWKRDVREGWEILGRYRTIVWNLLAHIKAVTPQRGSFADLLLKAKDPKTGKQLSDNQMFPEIAALFFAGIDTTGHTGTFFLYMVSQHPEVEAKILAELDSLELSITPQRPHPRKMTYADVNQLTYLQATIKEVLRMYPPVGIGQIRVAEKHDIVLGGKLHIPAGTIMWIPHHAIQNVSFNWDDHDKFLPERWLTPGTEYAVTEKLPLPREWYTDIETEAVAPGANNLMSTASLPAGFEFDETSDSKRPKRYFPFAEGPRSCVGQSLAKVSLVATMATLVQHFQFCLVDEMGGPQGVRESEQYTLVIGLKNGMSMHAVPRPGVMESLCNGAGEASEPAAENSAEKETLA
ncbi:g7335 [Coccomyxa viridis]|uniref:G7335 protein n=1 Tax=Coccomyxa viridis TaxID=1274662 RepID=A0ABP1FXK7_9CHLO